MIDFFDEVKLVNALTDGFPFVCPVCEEVHENWDYLRIYLKAKPNAVCIHLKCLLQVMKIDRDWLREIPVLPESKR